VAAGLAAGGLVGGEDGGLVAGAGSVAGVAGAGAGAGAGDSSPAFLDLFFERRLFEALDGIYNNKILNIFIK
jgi:hypothetical protein